MLAYDYPILGVLWTMLFLFVWVSALFIFFHVVIDIFRSRDMSVWAKAGWFLLTVLIYLLVRGDSMSERDVARVQAQQTEMDAYVRQAAVTPAGGVADELVKLGELRTSGVLSDEEFAAQKSKLLA
jgi:hypothetical protein